MLRKLALSKGWSTRWRVSDWRDDAIGGLVSASISLPLALGFGMFVFVSLGESYFFLGAKAGLISAITVSLACMLLGDRTATLYAPRVTTTFFLGSMLASLVHSTEPALRDASDALTLLILFAIMLLAALFQSLFGLLKLGTLIKFAPHPVMAGFQNMAAALLFLVQVGNVMGFDRSVSYTRVLAQSVETKGLSVVVAAVTFAAMWNARRVRASVPPLLVGLVCGIGLYYALYLAGFTAALGPRIGTTTGSAEIPTILHAITDSGSVVQLVSFAPVIVPAALALAIISAIDAMLCARLAGQPGDRRNNSDRMLVRVGTANLLAAMAGGITNGINIGATVTNRKYGGRSRLSVLVNVATLLIILIWGLPLIAWLPRSVLSALIMVIAVQQIDPWTRQAVTRLFKEGIAGKSALILDLSVATTVSLFAITVNVVMAVFLGLVLAVVLFVVRMSRSNVRRIYRCDLIRSRKTRPPDEMALLAINGPSIVVMELQGALFFGSAERLSQIIQAETETPTGTLILDLRRLTEIDATGARILSEIEAVIHRTGTVLMLIWPENHEIGARLGALPGRRMPDLDHAIEQAEDDFLALLAPPSIDAAELPLSDVALLRDFTADQIDRLRPHLERRELAAESVIFREGDFGTHLFLLARGRASVRLITQKRSMRLVTFAPGTVFGELAILDQGPRSATVIADEDLVVFALSAEHFASLLVREPDIAVKILAALGRELSNRLRHANMTIHQLEA